MSRLRSVVTSVCCLLIVAGCVRQHLTIRTEPPGAELLINGKSAGVTPYSHPFLWYGSYRFTLLKPGYERLDKQVLIRAPAHLWIPMDLAMEMLPFTVRDHRVFAWELMPSEPLPLPVPPEPEPVLPQPSSQPEPSAEGTPQPQSEE
jgi:hypothetical protein